ncbi:hypothetical protein FA15DRAFT_524393 [Coprinopsis marcescibilis]|uniref:Uncharacterized protein n=1 Tax=Coprinopsis marcescibilis TaxID=230819 RepID=A0A5C3KR86_COPMA|nr:hypothetical protein FA15DRAFT_524393 [Coprinopsis marcescibilis]
MRIISTLDRAKLLPSDYIDVSGLTSARADSRRKPTSSAAQRAIDFSYYADSSQPPDTQWLAHRFPVSTRGFLYWHNGQPQPPCSTPSSTSIPKAHPDVLAPAATSSIWFSLLSSPEHSKIPTEVQDLLLPSGAPWKISIKSLLTKPAYQPLRQMFVDDRFIPLSAVEAVDNMKRTESGFASMGEPFLCDLRAKTVLMKFGVDGEGEGKETGLGESLGHGGGCEGEAKIYGQMELLLLNLTNGKEARNGIDYAGFAILQLHRVTDAPEGYLGKSIVPLTEHELLELAKKNPKSPRVLFVLKILDTLTHSPSHPNPTATSPWIILWIILCLRCGKV